MENFKKELNEWKQTFKIVWKESIGRELLKKIGVLK